MKVTITDAPPDVHALHSGHMLLDSFDLIVLGCVVGFVVSFALCMCTGWRLLRHKDPVMDAKKAE